MRRVQCVVCGEVLVKNGTREDTQAQDHRDENHPDVKPSIPLTDLFRDYPKDGETDAE